MVDKINFHPRWKFFIVLIALLLHMIIQELTGLPRPAIRIISLVPSITELLSYLELDEQTIAITKFCVKPEAWFREKKRIGGTKTADVQSIINLQPDLVIANKEENIKEQVEAIAEHAPVLLTDINSLDDALKMIQDVAVLTGRHTRGNELVENIHKEFSALTFKKTVRAAYLVWKDPYMVSGGDTYINNMMEKAGFMNVFRTALRYPMVSLEDIGMHEPDAILLSSEPYPFDEKHKEYFTTKFPGTKIILVDGEMFSWYGSRLQDAPRYFTGLHKQMGLLEEKLL